MAGGPGYNGKVTGGRGAALSGPMNKQTTNVSPTTKKITTGATTTTPGGAFGPGGTGL